MSMQAENNLALAELEDFPTPVRPGRGRKRERNQEKKIGKRYLPEGKVPSKACTHFDNRCEGRQIGQEDVQGNFSICFLWQEPGHFSFGVTMASPSMSSSSQSEDDLLMNVYTSEEEITHSSDDASDTENENGNGDDIDVEDGIWTSIMGEDAGPQDIPFIAVPGPHHAPPPEADPVDYTNLFFTYGLINLMVRQTNLYSDQWVRANRQYLIHKPHSRVHQWIKGGHVSSQEMRAFLAVLFNMNLNPKHVKESYWDSTNKSQEMPWFLQRFNRDRFSLITKFLHFANNADAAGEGHTLYKTYKVQPIVDHFNNRFKHYFPPYKNIAIDESMVGFKGRLPHLRQFMPNKRHARFGVKVWCLCDSSTRYMYSFEIFKGANDPDDRHEHGATYALVMRMMMAANLLRMGYHLGLDNYFTSPKLLFDIFQGHTPATGTVRKNRKGLPKSIINAKLEKKEVAERRKGNLLCVAYKDNTRQPILLSTYAKGGFMDTTNSKGKTRNLPKIIVEYNKAMGGVDLSDARLYKYLTERRTIKWTHKFAFSLFGRALLNAFILYQKNTCDVPKKTRYQFYVSVVEDMIDDFRPPHKVIRKRRSHEEIRAANQLEPIIEPPLNPAQPGPSPCKLVKLDVGKRRDCAHNHTERVRSSYECPTCNVGLCPLCFAGYHARRRRDQQ
ncbi:PiggyBac transposable element-derived protein 4 [Elysia marginata]|uniref:PiggyBac transposable element-derived protein 4 n=1 Tax=Elysia marginata TaxID=1093978 RepID=A0AAV4GSF7_9GAST|nr:PiggyBac transposable element-derived protein 4 [Elysia marginata]